jgi:hypothetical protein
VTGENLATALVAFQNELPKLGKGQRATVQTKAGGSYSYDYADLSDITETVIPLLAKHGLAFTAAPTVDDAGFILRYELLHTSGEVTAGAYPLPSPSQHSPQDVGSAITYARRYALCAVTAVAPGGDDDDGQKAAQSRTEKPRQSRTSDWETSDKPRRAQRSGEKEVYAAEVSRVKAAGARVGLDDMDALATDFASRHEGNVLRDADVEGLRSYVRDLQAAADALDSAAEAAETNAATTDGEPADPPADRREARAEEAGAPF